VIPAPTRYLRPSSLEEALQALLEPEARPLAGGQSLLPAMKLRLARPSLLVDLSPLPLRGMAADGKSLRIGALTTWDELARARELRCPGLAAVGECAAGIGDLQVRNRGTLGGGLAHADPAADMPAVALALGARLRLGSLEGERELPCAELYLGPFTTALRPGELIMEVVLPQPPPGAGSAYVAFEHPASDFALAGACAVVLPEGDARVALTGVSGRPLLLPAADEPEEALATVEVLGDRLAPAAYRRQLATVAVRRALALARARARGEGAA
jgi:carbon-monoxide dehydrogenase medium subunit